MPGPKSSTQGCTSCGSEKTDTVDGVHGRRCAHCPPAYSAKHLAGLIANGLGVTAYARTVATLPPGCYRPDLADHMIELGRSDAAFAYMQAAFARDIDHRFAELAAAL